MTTFVVVFFEVFLTPKGTKKSKIEIIHVIGLENACLLKKNEPN
jgi:hypothetical protein